MTALPDTHTHTKHEQRPSLNLLQVVAPAVRPIAYDRAPAVREAAFLALGRWMGASTGGTLHQSSERAGEQLHMTHLSFHMIHFTLCCLLVSSSA